MKCWRRKQIAVIFKGFWRSLTCPSSLPFPALNLNKVETKIKVIYGKLESVETSGCEMCGSRAGVREAVLPKQWADRTGKFTDLMDMSFSFSFSF